jgi:hypothetical protein
MVCAPSCLGQLFYDQDDALERRMQIIFTMQRTVLIIIMAGSPIVSETAGDIFLARKSLEFPLSKLDVDFS